MDLIDHLENLRTTLECLKTDLDASGVRRTTGLKAAMGETCHYYRKSKDLFLSHDYDRIKASLLQTIEQLELVEGKSIQEIILEHKNH